ncbi:MAG: hypothetical protein IKF52_04000 [Clostridia bacterium]|nr:hypothetical protein [Clostridia bacterium]
MKKRKMDEEYMMRMKSMLFFSIYMIAVGGNLVICLRASCLQRMALTSAILASFTQFIFYEYSLKKARFLYKDLMIILIWLTIFLMDLFKLIM